MRRLRQSIALFAAALVLVAPLSRAQTQRVESSAENLLEPAQAAQAHFTRGVQLMKEKKFLGAAEAFERALASDPKLIEGYNNWGISLVQLAKQAPQQQQQFQYLQLATDKFAKAADLKPDDKITFLLWSETLVLLGDLPLDARTRLACYQGAVEKARRATELAPDDWEAYNKWGAILSSKLLGFAVDDKARYQLFQEAAGLFGKAADRARFSGELGPVYANWASALVGAARLAKTNEDKQRYLRDALEKFDRSARAIPNAAATYAMWGSALIDLGKISRLRGDLRDGIDRLNTSLALNPNNPAALYNLACAYALMDNAVLAVQNLKKCFEADPNNTYLSLAARDPDLGALKGNPDFDEIFNPSPGPRGLPKYNPPIRSE